MAFPVTMSHATTRLNTCVFKCFSRNSPTHSAITTTYLQCRALIRERWTEECYQYIHHSRRYVFLENYVGMLSIMRCNTHLSIKTSHTFFQRSAGDMSLLSFCTRSIHSQSGWPSHFQWRTGDQPSVKLKWHLWILRSGVFLEPGNVVEDGVSAMGDTAQYG